MKVGTGGRKRRTWGKLIDIGQFTIKLFYITYLLVVFGDHWTTNSIENAEIMFHGWIQAHVVSHTSIYTALPDRIMVAGHQRELKESPRQTTGS